MEQWKVECPEEGYSRIYLKHHGAKRDFGSWCRQINEEEEGHIIMFYRKELNDEWNILEEFKLNVPTKRK